MRQRGGLRSISFDAIDRAVDRARDWRRKPPRRMDPPAPPAPKFKSDDERRQWQEHLRRIRVRRACIELRNRQRERIDWRDHRIFDAADRELSVEQQANVWKARESLEQKLARHAHDAEVRRLVARKLRACLRLGLSPRTMKSGRFEQLIDKLEAVRSGHIGATDEGAGVVVTAQRSDCPLLDPSESRLKGRDQAMRILPRLLELIDRGYRPYYAVFSESNVAAGALRWGKEHLFQRIRRVILERDEQGRPLPDQERTLSEICGAWLCQEDPLGRDRVSWNVHVNALLMVDPRHCTRLDADRCTELGIVDRAPAGCLSFAKIHALWGSDQVELRLLPNDREALEKALREIIKYSCKTVSKDALERARRCSSEALLRVVDPDNSPTTPLELHAPPSSGPRAPRRDRHPPPLIDWPEPRVIEYLEANHRFRRIRSYGCLYRLEASPQRRPLDQSTTWIGFVQVAAGRLDVRSPIGLIQGFISSVVSAAVSGRSYAHAGQGPPPPAPVVLRSASGEAIEGPGR